MSRLSRGAEVVEPRCCNRCDNLQWPGWEKIIKTPTGPRGLPILISEPRARTGHPNIEFFDSVEMDFVPLSTSFATMAAVREDFSHRLIEKHLPAFQGSSRVPVIR
jgi:hypothetical protein